MSYGSWVYAVWTWRSVEQEFWIFLFFYVQIYCVFQDNMHLQNKATHKKDQVFFNKHFFLLVSVSRLLLNKSPACMWRQCFSFVCFLIMSWYCSSWSAADNMKSIWQVDIKFACHNDGNQTFSTLGCINVTHVNIDFLLFCSFIYI